MPKRKALKKVAIGICIAVGSLVVLILIFMLFSAISKILFSRAMLDRSIKDITNETDTVPAYVEYGELHIGNECVDIFNIHDEQNNTSSAQDIFCVNDGKAYYLHIRNDLWTIASIDLDTKFIQNHCAFTEPTEAYSSEHYDEYSERMSFYYDGQIVLNDFSTVVVYDVATGKTSQYAYEQYVFPKRRIYSEYANNVLKLHIDDEVRVFTLEDMASQSESIAKISELKYKTDWQKNSYLTDFLVHDTIEVIGDNVYYIGSISNWMGEPSAIMLKYDPINDKWMYVTKEFVGWDVHRRCYVIEQQ